MNFIVNRLRSRTPPAKPTLIVTGHEPLACAQQHAVGIGDTELQAWRKSPGEHHEVICCLGTTKFARSALE